MGEGVGGQEPVGLNLCRGVQIIVRGKHLFGAGADRAGSQAGVQTDAIAVGLGLRVKAGAVDQFQLILLGSTYSVSPIDWYARGPSNAPMDDQSWA